MSTKIDSNFEGVAQADDLSNATPLKVDPVTGRLLVDVSIVSSGGVVNSINPADGNFERPGMGVADNANSTPLPFQTDTNGNLLVDILIE